MIRFVYIAYWAQGVVMIRFSHHVKSSRKERVEEWNLLRRSTKLEESICKYGKAERKKKKRDSRQNEISLEDEKKENKIWFYRWKEQKMLLDREE